MSRLSRMLSFSLCVWAAAARAGTILTWTENGTREGKPWTNTTTAYSSEQGLRADVVETIGGKTSSMTFLYLRAPRVVHIVQDGARVASLDQALLDGLAAKAKAAGKDLETHPKVTALETKHRYNGFDCKDVRIEHAGQPTTVVCVAPAASLGVDEETVSNLRGLGDLMTPFGMAMKRLKPDDKNDPDPFNSWALPQGFPVREAVVRGGSLDHEQLLLAVKKGDTPARLFEVPPEKAKDSR